MDFRKLLSNYTDEIVVREWDDFAVFAIPVFFLGTMDSMAVSVKKIDNGFIFADCHRVHDYWEEIDFDFKESEERINKICDAFNIEKQENVFMMTARSECDTVLMNMFGYFLQAMILLANVAI